MIVIKYLDVDFNGRAVGKLAITNDQRVAFQYDNDWLRNGFSISPISLPLTGALFVPNLNPFDGIFGVFNDSLPDGFGRLLVDRYIQKHRDDFSTINQLVRLSLVGNYVMGGLSYSPSTDVNTNASLSDESIENLASKCKSFIETDTEENIDELILYSGSSGGARPKVIYKIDNEEYIVKFPAQLDRKDIGYQEYKYNQCAKNCGIEIADCKLIPSKKGKGYFASKRFDRNKNKKIHMISASGLLETSHRIPNLDYLDLLKLTRVVTRDTREVKKMFKLMCFNVFAHNRDGHSKNFSFLYDEDKSQYILSPAYDLTYSNSIGLEHATTVNGKGTDIETNDLLEVANKAGININEAKEIIDKVEDVVKTELKEYLE